MTQVSPLPQKLIGIAQPLGGADGTNVASDPAEDGPAFLELVEKSGGHADPRTDDTALMGAVQPAAAFIVFPPRSSFVRMAGIAVESFAAPPENAAGSTGIASDQTSEEIWRPGTTAPEPAASTPSLPALGPPVISILSDKPSALIEGAAPTSFSKAKAATQPDTMPGAVPDSDEGYESDLPSTALGLPETGVADAKRPTLPDPSAENMTTDRAAAGLPVNPPHQHDAIPPPPRLSCVQHVIAGSVQKPLLVDAPVRAPEPEQIAAFEAGLKPLHQPSEAGIQQDDHAGQALLEKQRGVTGDQVRVPSTDGVRLVDHGGQALPETPPSAVGRHRVHLPLDGMHLASQAAYGAPTKQPGAEEHLLRSLWLHPDAEPIADIADKPLDVAAEQDTPDLPPLRDPKPPVTQFMPTPLLGGAVAEQEGRPLPRDLVAPDMRSLEPSLRPEGHIPLRPKEPTVLATTVAFPENEEVVSGAVGDSLIRSTGSHPFRADAVPGSAPSPPAVHVQIVQAVAATTGGVTELCLAPDELGHIRIDMRDDGDRLIVMISAERPETLDLLRRNADQLATELRGAGHSSLDLNFGGWSDRETDRNPQEPTAAMQTQDAISPTSTLNGPANQPLPTGLYLRI